MLGLEIILAHMAGDYLFQTNWMALEKTKRWSPAVAHGITYTLPYALITQSWLALLVIGGTHVVIDHYRLARHVVWLKNQLAPRAFRTPHTTTGYGDDMPPWMAVWLMIVADNTLHLLINLAAIKWL